MNPLMMLFGGYGCGSNAGFPMADYSAICRNAMMQSMGTGLFGFGFGGISPMSVATQVTQTSGGSGASSAPATVSKAQVNQAETAWEDLDKLCKKVESYKNDTTTQRDTLKGNADSAHSSVTTAEGNIATNNKDLTGKLEEIAKLQAAISDPAQKDKINDNRAKLQTAQKAAEDIQATIKTENEKLQKAKEDEKAALMELEAFDAAKEESQEQYTKMKTDRDAAYKNYINILKAYQEQLTQQVNQTSERQDKAQEKEAAGNWWGRSKANPKNWTNLNLKGKNDPSANVAKCLRILKGKGLNAAIEYATANNRKLISIDSTTGKATTTHKDLQELCDLYTNGYENRKLRGEIE